MNSRNFDLARIQHLLKPQVLDAERQRRRSPFLTMFADTGPCGREFYAKHLEFFHAGARYNQRLFMAANRVGNRGYDKLRRGERLKWDEVRLWTLPCSF